MVSALGEPLIGIIFRYEEEEETFILVNGLPEPAIAAGYSQKPEPEKVKGEIVVKKTIDTFVEQLNPNVDPTIHSFSMVFIINLQKHLQDITVISY